MRFFFLCTRWCSEVRVINHWCCWKTAAELLFCFQLWLKEEEPTVVQWCHFQRGQKHKLQLDLLLTAASVLTLEPRFTAIRSDHSGCVESHPCVRHLVQHKVNPGTVHNNPRIVYVHRWFVFSISKSVILPLVKVWWFPETPWPCLLLRLNVLSTPLSLLSSLSLPGGRSR